MSVEAPLTWKGVCLMGFIKAGNGSSRAAEKQVLMTDSGLNLEIVNLDKNDFNGGESSLDLAKKLRTPHIFHKKEGFFGYFSHSIFEKTLFYSVTIVGLILFVSAILWRMVK